MPLVDIKAEKIADAFFSGWIARFGTPATITTDRGAQFESNYGIICATNSVYSQKSHNELPPPVEWHSRALSSST